MIRSFNQTVFGRTVATIVSAAVLWIHISPAIAASEFDDAAQAGEAFGKSIAPSVDIFSFDQATGKATLYPDASDPVELDQNDIFPGSSSGGNVNDFSKYYDSQNGMEQAGSTANSNLAVDPTEWGDAYRVLKETNSLSRPNLSNDPIWNQSDELLADFGDLSGEYADCEVSETVTDGTVDAHIPDYKTCEKLTKPEGSCVAYHDYQAGVISHVRGPYNISSCGDGCMLLWIGRVGDNYWGGSCAIYQQNTVVEVLKPEAVESAVLEYAKWDDYMQVYLNEDKVWQGPNGNFPPETGGACELNTSWAQNPNTDLSEHFQEYGELDFKIRVSVTGGGEGYGRIRIHYDPQYVVEENGWTPESCVKTIEGIDDGFCEGTYTCTTMPPVSSSGCGTVNGVTVCPDDLESVSDNISPLCQRVSVTSDCNFNEGQMDCWVDTQGVEHCPNNDGTIEDTCQQYQDDPSCGFISSSCVGYAQGESGECYVTEETWDCGETIEVPTKIIDKTYDCAGSIRCMGTDCINPEFETSTDFATAAAAIQAAQQMASDTECDVVDIEDNNECRIFPGESYECKKAVGGVVDCCSGNGGGVGLTEYLTLANATLKAGAFVDGQLAGLATDSALGGWYSSFRQPFVDGWEFIDNGLATAWDTVTGGTNAAAAAGSEVAKEGFITGFKQEIVGSIAQWTGEMFGAQAQSLLFTQNAAGVWTLGGPGAYVGTMLSWVMTAYMVYQIVMILIQIIWACEQKEFELQAKREIKTCHHVGSYCASKVLGACLEKRESYCCFNSPLSRILQEQVRPQLGRGWGSPEEPECGPILAEDLSEVDFSQVDLSEWTGMLHQANLLPTADSVNIESLTGEGSNFDAGDGRANALERAQERIDGLDGDQIREDLSETLPTP
tara:strand:- start:11423 stop:14104 length:2682 start_codon:yes stop_codon:yes gene_type:complete